MDIFIGILTHIVTLTIKNIKGNKKMKNVVMFMCLLVSCSLFVGCKEKPIHQTADQQINRQQEGMAQQANKEAGMPGISNFTEKKTMRKILEKRDSANLVTYGYIWSPMLAKFRFVGIGYGYPLPYATQYTNPTRIARHDEVPYVGNVTLPQADPTGLWSPASADATWWLMMDEETKSVDAEYFEERINVVLHKLPKRMVIQD